MSTGGRYPSSIRDSTSCRVSAAEGEALSTRAIGSSERERTGGPHCGPARGGLHGASPGERELLERNLLRGGLEWERSGGRPDRRAGGREISPRLGVSVARIGRRGLARCSRRAPYRRGGQPLPPRDRSSQGATSGSSDGGSTLRLREKVTGRLSAWTEAPSPRSRLSSTLLDLSVDDGAWQALDPPQRRKGTLQAVKRLLLRESRTAADRRSSRTSTGSTPRPRPFSTAWSRASPRPGSCSS